MEANGQGEVDGHEEGVWTVQRPVGTESSLQPRCWARQEFQWVILACSDHLVHLTLSYFSCKKGTRAASGPHLLWHFNFWSGQKRCEGDFGRWTVFYHFLTQGYPGGPVGFDWRHNGTLHWLLHPQWHRDSLLYFKVLSDENWERS